MRASAGSAPAASLKPHWSDGDMSDSRTASAGSAPAASLKQSYTAFTKIRPKEHASAGSAPAASLKLGVHQHVAEVPSWHPRGLPPRPH